MSILVNSDLFAHSEPGYAWSAVLSCEVRYLLCMATVQQEIYYFHTLRYALIVRTLLHAKILAVTCKCISCY